MRQRPHDLHHGSPLRGGAVSLTVRRAVLADLTYIRSLSDSEFNAIGFIPAGAYEWALGRQGPAWTAEYRLWLAAADDEPVGFLYANPGRPGGSARIAQICVQEDARRLEYATALTETAELWAAECQRQGVTCRVATDLEAGHFWDALQYDVAAIEPGGVRRGRILERRYKRLDCGLLAAA